MQARRLRAELERVQRAMAAGRWGPARKDLRDLARRWPGRGEVLFLLGRCEEALGNPSEPWLRGRRSRPGTASYPRAAESRASVLMNLGRFAPAEACLLEALRAGPGRRSLSPARTPSPASCGWRAATPR